MEQSIFKTFVVITFSYVCICVCVWSVCMSVGILGIHMEV